MNAIEILPRREYVPSSRAPTPPLISVAHDSDWADSTADLRLINTCDESNLDVQITPQGRRLVQVPFSQRFSRFFSLSPAQAELDRQGRLNEYIRVAYDEVPPLRNRAQKIEFYKGLKKWKNFNLGNLSENVQKNLSEQMRAALQEGQRAKADLRKFRVGRDHRIVPGLESALEENRKALKRAKWGIRVAEIQLAKDLGILPKETGAGANGALFGLGLDERRLAVIKQNSKGSFFNERFIGERPQLEVCQHDPRVAGAVAYLADEYFGFDLIPQTFLDDKGHSYQLFVDGTVDADSAAIKGQKLRDIPADQFSSDQMESLQLKAVLNYFLGDLDAKDDKLRIRLDENGNITEFYETDNDNILPQEELNDDDDLQTLRKTHQWKDHNWAQVPFDPKSPRMAKVLNKLFDDKAMDRFIHASSRKYPNFWTSEKLIHMRERVAIIRTCMELGYSPFMLGVFYGRQVIAKSEFAREYRMMNEFLSGAGVDDGSFLRPDPHAAAFAVRFDDDVKESLTSDISQEIL